MIDSIAFIIWFTRTLGSALQLRWLFNLKSKFKFGTARKARKFQKSKIKFFQKALNFIFSI